MNTQFLLPVVLALVVGWFARHKGLFAPQRKVTPAEKLVAPLTAELVTAAPAELETITLARLCAKHTAIKKELAEADRVIKEVVQGT